MLIEIVLCKNVAVKCVEEGVPLDEEGMLKCQANRYSNISQRVNKGKGMI